MVDIRVLIRRNELRSRNKLTVAQLKNLLSATEKAAAVHMLTEADPPRPLTHEKIQLMREPIDIAIVSILKLELAKKRD